jgi:hypothetical protein
MLLCLNNAVLSQQCCSAGVLTPGPSLPALLTPHRSRAPLLLPLSILLSLSLIALPSLSPSLSLLPLPPPLLLLSLPPRLPSSGSGKTHTMFGPDPDAGADLHAASASAGIVPRACGEVMAALERRKQQGVRTRLLVSYVEVFGEAVTDLLNDNAAVGAWHGVAHRAVHSGEVAVPVHDQATLALLLQRADSNKCRAATDMNARSSRAHSLLLLRLLQVLLGSLSSSVHFAGSPRLLLGAVFGLAREMGGRLRARYHRCSDLVADEDFHSQSL